MQEYNFDVLSQTTEDIYQTTLSPLTPIGGLGSFSLTTAIQGVMPMSDQVSINSDGIQLHDNADLTIGDQSFKEFVKSTNDLLQRMSERINILTVDPRLEQQWKELSELGEKYRQLENEILEKMKIWNQLKS
jgi:hypothetical protein